METKIEIGSWRDNEMNIKDFKWTREPDDYTLTDDKIEILHSLVHRFRNNYTTHLSANPIAQV